MKPYSESHMWYLGYLERRIAELKQQLMRELMRAAFDCPDAW